MTLHDVRRLSDYAKKNPPLRVLVHLVARALGVEFKEQKEEKPNYPTAEQMKALMNLTKGRVPGMGAP